MVGDVRAVAGQELDDGYWTVTVAARVTDVAPEPPSEDEEVDEEDEPVAQTWYVEVGIVGEVANGLAAIATPAIMPTPPPVSDEWRRTGEDATTPDAGNPVVEAVQGFLEAVLTGSGDPSRYTAPGLDVEALDPAPFTDVRVIEMALEDLDAGEVSAWVQAQVTTESGAHQMVAYEFVAVPRVNRWEIIEFWGSPSEIEGPAPAPPPEATEDTSEDDAPTDGEGDGTSSDDTTGTTASGDGSDGTSTDTTADDAPDTTTGRTPRGPTAASSAPRRCRTRAAPGCRPSELCPEARGFSPRAAHRLRRSPFVRAARRCPVVDIMAGFMEDTKFLVILAIGVMALIIVVAVWVRSKAFVPTLGAVLFGAVVTWAVHNVDFLQTRSTRSSRPRHPGRTSVTRRQWLTSRTTTHLRQLHPRPPPPDGAGPDRRVGAAVPADARPARAC